MSNSQLFKKEPSKEFVLRVLKKFGISNKKKQQNTIKFRILFLYVSSEILAPLWCLTFGRRSIFGSANGLKVLICGNGLSLTARASGHISLNNYWR